MSSPNKATTVTKHVDPSLQKIVRALAGGNTMSIAKAVFSHSAICQCLVEKVIDVVNEECTTLCRKSLQPVSRFRQLPTDHADEFSWKECVAELIKFCPTILQLFTKIVSRSDHRNVHKRGEHHYPGICMALAVLLKERNREMSGIQSLISLTLFDTRVHKKVCWCTCTTVCE